MSSRRRTANRKFFQFSRVHKQMDVDGQFAATKLGWRRQIIFTRIYFNRFSVSAVSCVIQMRHAIRLMRPFLDCLYSLCVRCAYNVHQEHGEATTTQSPMIDFRDRNCVRRASDNVFVQNLIFLVHLEVLNAPISIQDAAKDKTKYDLPYYILNNELEWHCQSSATYRIECHAFIACHTTTDITNTSHHPKWAHAMTSNCCNSLTRYVCRAHSFDCVDRLFVRTIRNMRLLQ